MIKRFFSLSLMIFLATTAWADNPVAINKTTLWTFGSLETATFTETPHAINGLYASGHSSSSFASIEDGSVSINIDDADKPTDTDELAIFNAYFPTSATKRLSFSGGSNTNIALTISANTHVNDRAAFYASVPGTVYAYVAGTTKSGENRYLRIYEGTNSSNYNKHDTEFTSTSPFLVKQEIAAASNVFIGSTSGKLYTYAILFIPAEKISTPSISYANGQVTISGGASSTSAATAIYYTTDGSTPSATNGTVYSGAFNASDGTVVKAISVSENGPESFVAEKTLEVVPTVTTISERTSWTLSGVDNNTTLNTANLVNWNNSGLFLRSNNADGNHSISARTASGASGTFSNGTGWSATMAFRCPANSELAPSTNAANAETVGSKNDRCLAFNVSVAGTVYVAIKSESNQSARKLQVFFNGNEVASCSAENTDWTELRATNAESGTYYIGGTNACQIAYILFVPGEMWNPTTTLTPENVSVASVTYNGTEQTAVVKFNGTTDLVEGTDYDISIANSNKGTNADNYTFSITGKGNYTGTISDLTFTINKATLTATADNKSKTEGEANPELTVTVTGFVNEETASTAAGYTVPAASTEATNESKAGEYPITVSGGSATNYNFNYVNGTLTVSAPGPSTHTLTVSSELIGGSIAADPSGEIASGTQVTLTITPSKGYQLKSGTLKYTYNDGEDHVVAINEETKTFEMPAYTIHLTAEFEPITYTISYYGLEGANLSGMNPETYTVETDAFTLINPTKDNSEFAGWTGTELNSASTSVTINKGSTGNREYTATWTENTPAGEPMVSTSTLWTFEDLTGTISSHTQVKESAYLRAYPRPNNNNDRQFDVAEATGSVTFDGIEVPYTKKVTASAKMVGTSSNSFTTDATAGMTSPSVLLPSFAFNADVAGTVYVAMKSTVTTEKGQRIYFNDGTEAKVVKQVTATGEIDVISYTSTKAGSFFIGDVQGSYELYAIKFVPTPTPTEATITADAIQSTTYNGTAQALAASVSAGGVTITYYSNAEHSAGETTTAPTNAGTYYAIVSQSDANYTSTPVNVTYTIQPKDLTITAKKQTVSVDGSITEGVGQVTTDGLVEGDELTGITLVASSTEAATESGSITPSNAVIKNGASNYNISYVGGILIVEAGAQFYNIVVPTAINGNSVSANPTSATEGTEITLTITTAENYMLASINADNNVTLNGSGDTRTFSMPAANVTITATWTINQNDAGDSNTSETYTVTETGGIEVSSVTTSANSSSITIPAQVGSTNVTAIADNAFNSISNKSEIKSIDLSATSITGVAVSRTSGVFSGFPEETIIYMPADNTAASGEKNVIIGGICSDFVMTDTKSYKIPKAFKAVSATVSRTFKESKYCTLCLPYTIPSGNLSGKVYEFSGVNGETVTMTESNDGLQANKPYIFVPNANVNGMTISDNSIYISINMSDSPHTVNSEANFTFKGVFENMDFSLDDISNGIYGFAAEANYGASIGQFVKAANGASIKGMRAYLSYNGTLNGTSTAATRGMALPEVLNVVLVHTNGSTTNIGRLELMTAEDGSPIYNLSGQRVDSSYKGIVIKNGKKVVIR